MKPQKIKAAASDAFDKVSEAARDAGSKVKQAATDTASTMTGQFKGLLDQQIGGGVDMAGHFASSVRIAADDLDKQSPALAGFVRNVADKVESVAEEFHGQTVDQLARTASDYTRRQPALVFGLAALAGFFLFRTVKSGSALSSPPIQPTQANEEQAYG
jgi:ElaB/YqjD/DUF883 family membrane-anchored ribosome-binding protein